MIRVLRMASTPKPESEPTPVATPAKLGETVADSAATRLTNAVTTPKVHVYQFREYVSVGYWKYRLISCGALALAIAGGLIR